MKDLIDGLKKTLTSLKGNEFKYQFIKEVNGRTDSCSAFVAQADIDVGITIHGFLNDEQKESFNVPGDVDDWPIDCLGRSITDCVNKTYSKQYILDIIHYIYAIKSGTVFGDVANSKDTNGLGAAEISENCPFNR